MEQTPPPSATEPFLASPEKRRKEAKLCRDVRRADNVPASRHLGDTQPEEDIGNEQKPDSADVEDAPSRKRRRKRERGELHL